MDRKLPERPTLDDITKNQIRYLMRASKHDCIRAENLIGVWERAGYNVNGLKHELDTYKIEYHLDRIPYKGV